jgi:hypothetical protein
MKVSKRFLSRHDFDSVRWTGYWHRRRRRGRRSRRKSQRFNFRQLDVFPSRFNPASDSEARAVDEIGHRILMEPPQIEVVE